MSGFEEAMVLFCQEDECNLFAVRKLRQTAWEKIIAGGGEIKSIISGSLNGKAHSSQIVMDASKLFQSLTNVITAVGTEDIGSEKSVTLDFSSITR